MRSALHTGDCLDVLKQYSDNHFDTCITDPPYGLEFMGKNWDHGVPGIPYWEEVLRVLKPGAILLAFGGTRTFHRLAVAIEDAGFEIRDTISWVYGSGFPKSYNVAKGIEGKLTQGSANWSDWKSLSGNDKEGGELGYVKGQAKQGYRPDYTGHGRNFELEATTDEAKVWTGWGTSIKPSWEPIIVARKPLYISNVDNALTHGVAGFNIDAARIATEGEEITINTWDDGAQPFGDGAGKPFTGRTESRGRWPANLVHDGSDEVMRLFPDSKGHHQGPGKDSGAYWSNKDGERSERGFSDQGSAARFFYTAKASRSERNAGLERFDPITTSDGRDKAADNAYQRGKSFRQNHHPTVKPIDLMRWLAVLTSTPTGGSVLDPFMGSGSTGIGCQLAGRLEFVGIDLDPEYVEIARARMRHWSGEKALGEWQTGKPATAANLDDLPLFGEMEKEN